MDKLKDVTKGGWHPPGKNGGKESWRGDFKGVGQVAGWMGKGKSGAHEDPHDHRSRPLASLKDPEAFGPPPKNVRYHGGAAVPDTITPGRSGLEAAVQLKNPRNAEAGPEEAPSPPPVPFRADRTGLDTAALLTPPTYRPNRDVSPDSPGAFAGAKPKPSLPPRLPPRRNSELSQGVSLLEPPSSSAALQPRSILNQSALNRLGSAGVSVPGLDIGRQPEAAMPEVSSHNAALQPQSILNKSAMDRLGSAGVSVPGFGIGRQPGAENSWQDEPSSTTNRTASPTSTRPEGANELQSKFAKLSTHITPPSSPSQGTTFAEKQAAFKTANAFRNNPSSITLADGKNAVSTANNFRERHGDQVAAGWQSASGLNKKYGIANKISGLAPDTAGASCPSAPSPLADPGASSCSPSNVKKPPPPPPKRIGGLTSKASQAPPVPQGTKPKF
ncbi:hypothetical protein MMC30_006343 [Trapelia coarctata]|nr:hypothetical protein [Trapelia coarctata]